MRAFGIVVAVVLVLILGGCSRNTVTQDVTSDYQFGVERGFAPDVPIIVEESELSEEPLYDTVAEALQAQQDTLFAQSESSPKTAKLRTHRFSNGKTFTYMVYQGVIFDGDIILGTYKDLIATFADYEEKLGSHSEIEAQGGFVESVCFFFYLGGPCGRKSTPWPNSILSVDRDSIIKNFTSSQQAQIFAALNEFDQKTDVTVAYRSKGGRVVFTNSPGGCYSEIGYQGLFSGFLQQDASPQYINLESACFSPWDNRTPIHEIGHALGLIHEHQRPDRDTYITVNTGNLTEKGKSNVLTKATTSFTTSYDYASVMHYRQFTGDTSFILNSKPAYFLYYKSL